MTVMRKDTQKTGQKSRHTPIPQPHGGALVPGGGRGPKPGAPNAGRPPSAIRALMRESFAVRIPLAEAIADNPRISPADRLRALDLLGRYGLGTTRELSVEEVRERLTQTIVAVRAIVPARHVETLLATLRQVWT
jgi:hypothetical protein